MPELFTADFASGAFEEMGTPLHIADKGGVRGGGWGVDSTRIRQCEESHFPAFLRTVMMEKVLCGSIRKLSRCFVQKNYGSRSYYIRWGGEVSKAARANVQESPNVKEMNKKGGSAPVVGEVPIRGFTRRENPIHVEDREWSKQHRHMGKATGEYLCWGYSSHAGCTEKNSECATRQS